ncbi:serine/threonine-protein phosphatase [Crossiella sp. SN42]|uniref:PP2C family protein-serine/threonine phosphatase n=1 Tax=Crossiella sp. SN42 TaxID=2944808 RepID=UPI00207CB948|nr:PP2C family serine/threonine-protein phosphatase [Crossiella sp. SN42]MCO1582051.1 serine/threonine-protein phosphatase [Crossiella sp. SN42]
MTTLVLTAAAGSETGNRYRSNFDRAHLSLDPLLAVVADGMGDGPGSTMAAQTAVDLVVEHGRAAPAALGAAVALAHQRIADFGREIGGLAGCTLTALAQTPEGFWLAQLGDSRLYRLRAGLLELLTVDHTMAWLGAVHGWYPFDSRQAASARYQLTRYLGHPAHPDPDLMKINPRPGDTFLLCTDGIAEQVSYQQLLATLGSGNTPAAMVRDLLSAAEAAGGNDNATAIVITATGA